MNLEQAKAKIQKLLSLGENAGATPNEAETALRQADALMRKFNLSRQDTVGAGAHAQYNWESGYYQFGREGKPTQSNPKWFQQLAVGVARFTDCIARQRIDPLHGAGVTFHGDESDVIFALWLISHLKDELRRATHEAKVGSKLAREDFRFKMAQSLCQRMREIKARRDQDYQNQSTGTAIVVVSDKLAKRDEEFGGECYSKGAQRNFREADATRAAHEAAQRVQFNRPIDTNNTTKKLS